jgi:hypothetical protein
MTGRKVPSLEGLRNSDFTGLEILTVSGHATERYENLRTVLCMLYPLRQRKLIPASTVTIAGAEWQKERGSRADDTQAAHTMPRRLMIGGKSLAEWLKASHDEFLQFALKTIEGTVTTLPSYVNKADTAWENSGLSQAYADAAREELHAWPADASAAAIHFSGVWTRFHHAAGAALARATAGASGNIAGVLGQYAVVHGQNRFNANEGGLVRYYWDILI